MNLYLIGSLRNPDIPAIAQQLRAGGHEVFDDWHAAGERGDDEWKRYEQARGRSYLEALDGLAAKHVFDWDYTHIHKCDAAVLVLPAGKSGHLELGYALGIGKRGFIVLDDPERWDVMYLFASKVFTTVDALAEHLTLDTDVFPVPPYTAVPWWKFNRG